MARRILGYLGNNAIGLLALFVALGGVSYAASGGFASNGGQLTACVGANGAMTLLKTGKHCRHGQTQVAWSEKGPAGAPGAKGETGAQGAVGPIGLPGTNGTPANVMWAQIEIDGVIEAGHGVTRVEDLGKSPYHVTFERPVDKCAVVATPDDLFTNKVVGDVHVPPEAETPNIADVFIDSLATGERVAGGFSIVAVC